MSSNSGPGYTSHPDHRVNVTPFRGRVVVEVAGEVIAESRAALVLHESTYPPVYYLPRSDVRMDRLTRSDHHSYCPFKGNASYFDLAGRASHAVWSYEQPYDEVREIREHLAFYPKYVDAIRVEPGTD